MPFLQLTKVEKYFGTAHVIRGITLDVAEREFISLIGPSGCGKTTLLKMIAGIEPATSGTIRLSNEQIVLGNEQAQWIVMVWQSLALFPHMNVGDNVAFGLVIRHVGEPERKRRMRDVLAKVGLAGYEKRSIYQLSGGEQQRVALARALVVRPRVLLLDEPFGALDAYLRYELQAELRSLHRELNLTIIMVTHDQKEAFALCDRVAVMRTGRVLQVDAPMRISGEPACGFVARFTRKYNVVSGSVKTYDGTQVFVETPAGVVAGVPAPWMSCPPINDQKVACLIRPDRVRLNQKVGTSLEGIFESVSDDGDERIAEIYVPQVGMIRATGSADKFGIIQKNDRINLSWSTEDVHVVPDSLPDVSG